jgi:hypothetical protein
MVRHPFEAKLGGPQRTPSRRRAQQSPTQRLPYHGRGPKTLRDGARARQHREGTSAENACEVGQHVLRQPRGGGQKLVGLSRRLERPNGRNYRSNKQLTLAAGLVAPFIPCRSARRQRSALASFRHRRARSGGADGASGLCVGMLRPRRGTGTADANTAARAALHVQNVLRRDYDLMPG